MNRCIVFAIIIIAVSAGVNELHESVDSLLEETDLGIFPFGGSSLQDGSTAEPSMWDTLLLWTWTWNEDEEDSRERAIARKKSKPLGGVLRVRNKEVVEKGLLRNE